MTDCVLAGGLVVDGTGAPAFPADVIVSADRIAGVVPRGSAEAAGPRVDVTDLVVAPGFIDMHAHSDLAVVYDMAHTAKVWQGVTLEVVGQDGLSYAPVTDEALYMLLEQLAGWNGVPDAEPDWRTVADYLGRVDGGAAVNVAYLVPHGTVRLGVIGMDDRPSSRDELGRMRALVAQGMAEGAMGLSAGLTYAPGMYAGDDEIVVLCGPVQDAGGYYCPHHRNYGAAVVQGYADCLAIARQARVALHLAHCHVSFPRNAGRAGEVLEVIDVGIDEGLDVTLDSYPYLAGATYLAALLPSWVHAGGTDAALRRLREPGQRSAILREMEVVGADGCHGLPVDWSKVIVSAVMNQALAWAVGSSLAALGASRGQPPGQVFCDLLVEDRLHSGCLTEIGNEENVRTIMRHPAHTGGSDGILVGARPHPRGWGTFPRFLGTYVRELGTLGLEECVAHLTSRAARRLGLHDRGVVRPGAWADLVVFDPETIAAEATYEEPCRQPTGIHHVLVNGEFTLRDGHRTDRCPGRAIRRQR